MSARARKTTGSPVAVVPIAVAAPASTPPMVSANVVRELDCVTQQYCERIAAIAHLANLALTPDVYALARVRTLLGMIEDQAEDLMNQVNVDAEAHGCEYRDEDGRAFLVEQRRKLDALLAELEHLQRMPHGPGQQGTTPEGLKQ